jgi:hypothetical protein
MPEPVLYKYLDFGERAMADLSLASGERVFVSIVPRGSAVHRTHLRGFVPGRRLFLADAEETTRMARVLARGQFEWPLLPRATKQHRDDSAMMEFLDAAVVDLKAVSEGKPNPGLTEVLELESRPERPLSLFTRLALASADSADLTRRFERVFNTPG